MIFHPQNLIKKAGSMVVTLAAALGFECVDKREMTQIRTQTAALLRKVMQIDGDYAKAGWSKIQVGSLW